jgi:hypothetical protein
LILCTKLSNIKALALTLGPGRKDGVTGNRERGTAMLIKKLIVRLRMWYADVRGHHGKRWDYEPGDWYMGRHKKIKK